jgi:uncharacterized protein YbjT (DUF2867 family)
MRRHEHRDNSMIVVTAPTGNIGHQVVDRLLADGSDVRVIARDPVRLSDAVRKNAEVVEGSHIDRAVVAKAFRGADALFWLVPPDPQADSLEDAYVEFSRPAAAAVAEQGVRRVVAVSALGRGTAMAGQAGLVTASLAMDDLMAGTGAHYRALTLPSFMDNLLRQAEAIRLQGLFFSPINGDRRMPFCATRDIAAVAAGLLRDEAWTGRASVAILGPEDLSFKDMALIISDVLDRPVRFQQIPFEAYKAQFLNRGASEAFAEGMTAMARAKDAGMDTAEARTPQNTTPTTFRKWCEDALRPVVLG